MPATKAVSMECRKPTWMDFFGLGSTVRSSTKPPIIAIM